MNVLQKCAWMIIGLGLVLPGGVPGQAQTTPAKVNKVMIYPGPADSIAQLKQSGISQIVDYGSYWLLETTDAQLQSLKKTHGSSVQKLDNLSRIQLKNAKFDTTLGPPAVPDELRQVAGSGKNLQLVQFKGPVLPQWLAQVQAAGATVVEYVPNNTYLVSVDAAGVNKLQSLRAAGGPIQWMGAYHPYYKIHSSLTKTNGEIMAAISILDGPEAEATVATLDKYSAGGVLSRVRFDHRLMLRLEVPTAAITAIAQLPTVLWIEPVRPVHLRDEVQDLILDSQVITTNIPVGASYFDFLTNQVAFSVVAADYPILDIADTGLDQEIGVLPPAVPNPLLVVNPDFYEFGNISNTTRVAYYLDYCGFGDHDGFGHGTHVASVAVGYENAASDLDEVSCDTIQTVTNQCQLVILTSQIICPPFGAPFSMICTQTTICSSANGTLCTTNEQCFVTPLTDCTLPSSGTFTNLCQPLDVVVTNTFQRLKRDNNHLQLGLGVSPFGRIGVSKITDDSGDFCTSDALGIADVALNAYLNRGRLQNNSWGEILTVGENDGLYDSLSQAFDSVVRDALGTGEGSNDTVNPLNQEFIVAVAGGNDQGIGSSGGIGDVLVTPPATAKNVITVGATENLRPTDGCLFFPSDSDNASSVAFFSSFGPTDDGRVKPDIMAPGASVWSAESSYASDLTCVNPAAPFDSRFDEQFAAVLYSCDSGTSFSSPAVSGAMQLLWWYFQNRLVNEQGENLLQPSPAMAKAYLCNSARYLPITNPQTGAMDTLPSSEQGMGMMDLSRMFDTEPRVLRDESPTRAIDSPLINTNPAPQQTYFTISGQSYVVSGQVADPTQPLRFTLAWTDAPGALEAAVELVNNLDLQVTVDGQTYLGNVFSEDHSILGGVPDSLNNLQSVFLPAGQTGTWTVVVQATDIAGLGVPHMGVDINQDFALVVYNGINASDVPNLATNNSPQTAALITQFPYTWTNTLTSTVYNQPFPNSTAGRGGPQEFFKIPLPTPGTVFSANTFGSSFNTLLSVWRGKVGSLAEVVSDSSASNTFQSYVTWTVSDTNDYYLVAQGRSTSTGQLILNVQATPPPFGFNTSLLDFGSVYLGTVSNMTVTLSNDTGGDAYISNVSIGGVNAGDFSIEGETCTGLFLPPFGTCQITVSFSPTVAGTRNATLVVSDNVTGSPHTLPMTGVGLAQVPLFCSSAPAGLSYGQVAIGFTSAVQSVTITNCGTAAMYVTNTVVAGAAASDYIISPDSCSGTLIQPGGICSVGVSFAPTAGGSRVAALVFNDNSAGPNAIPLTGTGTVPAPAVCLSSSTLNFDNVSVGSSSSASVTVTNCGSAALTFSSVNISGGSNQFSLASDTCSGSIPVGGTCTIGITFTPTGIGTASATLLIADNASDTPQSVALVANAVGSQPDAQISTKLNAKTYVGQGILSPPAPLSAQSVTQKGRKKQPYTYYVRCANDGNAADTYLVTGSGDVVGAYTVQYFLGALPSQSLDITAAVEAGTFATDSLAPGAVTSEATMIRVEITANPTGPLSTNTVQVTFTSQSNHGKTDTVGAVLVLPKR